MFDSLQQRLEAPVPFWLFLGAVAILWYRDYVIKKGVEVLGAILDRHSARG